MRQTHTALIVGGVLDGTLHQFTSTEGDVVRVTALFPGTAQRVTQAYSPMVLTLLGRRFLVLTLWGEDPLVILDRLRQHLLASIATSIVAED